MVAIRDGIGAIFGRVVTFVSFTWSPPTRGISLNFNSHRNRRDYYHYGAKFHCKVRFVV